MTGRVVVSRMSSLRYKDWDDHLHEQMAPVGQAGPGCGKRRGQKLALPVSHIAIQSPEEIWISKIQHKL